MSPFLRPSPVEAVNHGPCISSSDTLGFQCRPPPHTWTSPIQRSTFSPNLQLPCAAHLAAQPDRDMVPGAQSSPARETSLLPPFPSSPWSHQPLSTLRKPSFCPSVLSRYLPHCGPITLQTANQSMTLLQKPNCGSIKSGPRSYRPEWTVSFRLFSQVTLGFLFQRSSLSPILPTCPFS